MGCKELIESLRKAADEKAIAIWNDAEAEAAAATAEAERLLEPERERQEQRKKAALAEIASRTMSEAQNAARRSRLESEREIAGRLFELSRKALVGMRGPGYESLFAALVRELPPRPWKTVRVHPADKVLARRWFPDAEVISDGSVDGGLEVSTGAGGMRVDNTLGKRLERSWGDLLPPMMQEVYVELSKRSAA